MVSCILYVSSFLHNYSRKHDLKVSNPRNTDALPITGVGEMGFPFFFLIKQFWVDLCDCCVCSQGLPHPDGYVAQWENALLA